MIRKLFAGREKTISGTNSLLKHGLNPRKSRMGKLNKTGAEDSRRNISGKRDPANNTTTLFPVIDNSQLIHPNFGKEVYEIIV